MYPGKLSILVHRNPLVVFPSYSCVAVCNLFNHSPIFRHLHCFQYFATMNNAMINNSCKCIFVLEGYLLDKFLKVDLLWIKKQDPSVCCLQAKPFRPKDACRLKVRGWKSIYYANENEKKTRVAIHMLDKIDSKVNKTEDHRGREEEIKEDKIFFFLREGDNP